MAPTSKSSEQQAAEIREHIACGRLAAGFAQVQAWIEEDALNAAAFQVLADIRALRGESAMAEVARKRARELELIGLNRHPSIVVKRLEAIAFGVRRFEVDGYVVAGGVDWECSEGVQFAGVLMDGSGYLEVYEPWQLTAEDAEVEGLLAAAECAVVPRLYGRGAVAGDVLIAAGIEANAGKAYPYKVRALTRADFGGFGGADLALALLQLQGCGLGVRGLGLDALRFDGERGILRIGGTQRMRLLSEDERQLAPQAYLRCVLDEGGMACGQQFILESALRDGGVWSEAGQLRLVRTALFKRQRAINLREPSVESYCGERLHFEGSKQTAHMEAVVAGLEIAEGEQVLVVEAGAGNVPRALARRGTAVTMVDLDPSNLLRARALNTVERLKIEVLAHDFDIGPLGRAFGVVVIQAGLHHFDYPERVLQHVQASGCGRIYIEARLVEVGYKWTGGLYQRTRAWNYADWGSVEAALQGWLGAGYRLVGAQPTDFERRLIEFKRVGGGDHG